jgi:hypothetical protein
LIIHRLRGVVAAGPKLLIALAAFGIYVSMSSVTFAATTECLWVFPGSSLPNPVTDAAARQALVANSAASGVNLLYVSVYSSNPNSAGRYMYDDTAIADLVTKAHGAGMKVYAAYGAPDWPTFGCDPNGFPLQRMAEIDAYDATNTSAKFDGVVLDVEPPEPQTTAAYQALLGQYQCIRDALPAEVDLAVAIRFFWDDAIQYPADTGPTKPVYAHVIDLNLRNVVVMGYRDFAGTRDCDSGDGLICLDQDEISYARSLNKIDLILAGLETSDPATTGISNKETFFEEDQTAMNGQAQAVLDHFGILSGLGGFAIHNYQNSYLSGASPSWPQLNGSFPTVAHEVKITAVTRLANHHLRLQGMGVANRLYNVEISPDLTPNSFSAVGSATADATGILDYDDSSAVGPLKQFYRFSYP